MPNQTQQENLKDISKSGKDRKWKERKQQSLLLSELFGECFVASLTDMGYREEDARELITSMNNMAIDSMWCKKQDRTNKCADVLEFVRTEEGRLKLYRAWFCKDRLCPMCNWRRAMKFSVQIAQILQVIKDRDITGKPIFLTLTMKNVKGDRISESFSDFAKAFFKLMHYKAVKTYCLGAIRTSEITYNPKSDDYNTHIHCLLWMKPQYFKGGAYLSQAKWTELWQKAACLDYVPIVHVEAVKPKTPSEGDPTGLFAAVLEVAKYPVKPDAFKFLSTKKAVRQIKELEKGMYKKRLISFFGIFKDIRAELKQDDIEDGDLVNAEGEEDTAKVETVECYGYDRTAGDYLHLSTETVRSEHIKDWHMR